MIKNNMFSIGFRVSIVALSILISEMAWGAASSEEYQHPAGYVSVSNIEEMRAKHRQFDWAKQIVANKKQVCDEWMAYDINRLLDAAPKRRVGVYHLFSCPETKVRLEFSPIQNDNFRSPETGKIYRADEISPVYPENSPHYGTYYDGWGCLYVMYLGETCYQAGVLYQVLEDPNYAEWVSRVLLYYADEVIPNLVVDENFGPKRMLVYAREGDTIYLNKYIMAYELVRNAGFLTEPEKRRIEENFFRSVCDKAILDEEYHEDHNDIPHFLCTVIHAGIAIGEPRYLEFGFGYGDYAPEKRPEHRSLAYMIQHHFYDDGAHLDRCSGYHLYAATPFYRNLYIGHNLSHNDPDIFPPEIFDYFSAKHPKYNQVRGVTRWVSAMAPFDGVLPTVGDSMAATASAGLYDPFGEIAYRYCGFKELGLEASIIKGERPESALIVGSPKIETKDVKTDSANLSSGYAVLKQNNMYIALNALKPGGGHQHADRLNLLMYLNDRLMSMEKATPYNDMSLRDYSTYSWAHNLVVVDRESQPQGESLKPNQVPKVTQFLDHPEIGVIRVEGKNLYKSTQVYNRTVLRIENIIVDIFNVEGGETHDYLYHNYGEWTKTSAGSQFKNSNEPFDTPDYLIGGKKEYKTLNTTKSIQATWSLPSDPDSVYPLRRKPAEMTLTLLEAHKKPTTLYQLLTHPYEQHKPLTHTFLARRKGPQNRFIAVFESKMEGQRSSLTSTSHNKEGDISLSLNDTLMVRIKSRRDEGNTHSGEILTDGDYGICITRIGEELPQLVVLGEGTFLRHEDLDIRLSNPATAVLTRNTDEDSWNLSIFNPAQYITRAAGNEYDPVRDIPGAISWASHKDIQFTAKTPSSDKTAASRVKITDTK